MLRESINAVENDAEATLEDRKRAFTMVIHCIALLRNLAANDALKVRHKGQACIDRRSE